MLPRGLVQAVRSQLHFSQLSAWWSSTKGTCPTNVRYRITVPGQAFAFPFSKPPNEHTFPLASVGKNGSIKVCMDCGYTPVIPTHLCIVISFTKKQHLLILIFFRSVLAPYLVWKWCLSFTAFCTMDAYNHHLKLSRNLA